jgi:hypothetical protein
LIPLDSFLLDPLLLYLAGIVIVGVSSRIVKWRWRKFVALLFLLTLGVFWATSISLFFDFQWTHWIWEMSGASSGRDWMINSGVFHFDRYAIYHLSEEALLFCGAMYAAYPLWLKLGLDAGYVLFGRNSKQTGLLGVLF